MTNGRTIQTPAPATSAPSPARPARHARWLQNSANGCRRLRLTVTNRAGVVSHDYELEDTTTGYRLYRLDVTTQPATVKVYNLTAHKGGVLTCDCKDAQRRGRAALCKHSMGLRAALAALPF